MCFGMNCPNELDSGECGGNKHGPCPDSYEDEQEYEAAKQEMQDQLEEEADYKYEQEKDRRLGI